MKKQCKFCEATTNESQCNFHEIGWSAFSIDRKKSICYCPNHKKEGLALMIELLSKPRNSAKQINEERSCE